MITQDQFDENFYSNLPIFYYTSDRIGISGCVMFNEIYTFGLTIIDGDERHYMYLSMTDPEILIKHDKYKLSKEDLDELMNVLINQNGWEQIIDSLHKCIISDQLTDDYIKIDFGKIPNTPPNYLLLEGQ